MKKALTLIVAALVVASGVFLLTPVSSVGAQALDGICGDIQGESAVCDENNNAENRSPDTLVKGIINGFLFLVGAVSLLMIIVGGIMYVVSQGDSSSMTKAKNTILYAIVGLIVSFLAYAIVNFVIQLF